MNVAVFGLGYVGLTTALAIDKARIGIVIGYDIDEEKIVMLRNREAPFFEPGLQDLIDEHRMVLTTAVGLAINETTDMIIVCVGTPSTPEGRIDLSYIYRAMRDIANVLKFRERRIVIMLKSTAIPGTSEHCIRLIEEISGKEHGVDFGFIHCPEFLREGTALKDLGLPDKIIVGHKYDWEAEFSEEFHLEFYLGLGSMLEEEVMGTLFNCNYSNAEFIKYANNSFLATKISYMNELANIAECVPGADIKVIEKAIGMDFRINPRFLRAGVGFGGSCFSKDVQALVKFAEDSGHAAVMLEEVLAVNQYQRDWVDAMMSIAFRQPLGIDADPYMLGGPYEGINVAVLGLAFKPGTDDVRDAPSIEICQLLHGRGAELVLHDPKATASFERAVRFPCYFADSIEEALDGSDCAVILTEWDEYKNITAEKFKSLLRQPIVIDGRRIYNPREMEDAGIRYYGVGYGAG